MYKIFRCLFYCARADAIIQKLREHLTYIFLVSMGQPCCCTPSFPSTPAPVLANVRGDIQVKTLKNLDGGMELCEITVPDESLPLEIIDGQHRVEGLKSMVEEDKKFEGYPVIVSLFTFHDKYDEMLQFHIVNSRAKRVPTDLAQRHIFQMASKIGLPEVMMREGERKAFGAYVIPAVDDLNKDPKSVWHKKVQLPEKLFPTVCI